MRTLRRLAWAAVLAAGASGPAAAQVTGTTGGTTLGTTTGTGTTGFGTTGTTGTTGFGTTGNTGGNSGSSNGQTSGTQLAAFGAAANIAAPSTVSPPSSLQNSSSNQAVNASNIFRNTYGSVYYTGKAGSVNTAPGGFGTALFPQTTAAGGRGAAGGGLTGTGGTRAGAAGSAGVNTSDPGGILVPLPRQIAYSAQVQFRAPPAAPVQLLTDIRGTIDRTPMLANPGAVQVQVDGRTVTLRGAVRDEEEAHLVEGLVRLTPGVGAIKNELAYARP